MSRSRKSKASWKTDVHVGGAEVREGGRHSKQRWRVDDSDFVGVGVRNSGGGWKGATPSSARFCFFHPPLAWHLRLTKQADGVSCYSADNGISAHCIEVTGTLKLDDRSTYEATP